MDNVVILGAERSLRTQQGEDWAPLDMLRQLLSELEQNPAAVPKLIAVMQYEDGRVRWLTAGPMSGCLAAGLLFRAMQDVIE